MDTIYNLLKRAKGIKEKRQVDSITPEEVGKLHEDTLAYIASLEQSAEGLGVRKVYQTKNAMEVDTAPIGTNGKSLRYGQLVAIYDDIHADSPENGNIYVYQKPGWLLVGNIAGQKVDIVQSAGDSESAAMSQKAVTALLTEYDVSAANGGRAYTLADAIAAVPAELRKSGLTIKFVDSGSSKYAIWNGISPTWSTNVEDWRNAGKDVANNMNSEVLAPYVDMVLNDKGQNQYFYNGSKLQKYGNGWTASALNVERYKKTGYTQVILNITSPDYCSVQEIGGRNVTALKLFSGAKINENGTYTVELELITDLYLSQRTPFPKFTYTFVKVQDLYEIRKGTLEVKSSLRKLQNTVKNNEVVELGNTSVVNVASGVENIAPAYPFENGGYLNKIKFDTSKFTDADIKTLVVFTAEKTDDAPTYTITNVHKVGLLLPYPADGILDVSDLGIEIPKNGLLGFNCRKITYSSTANGRYDRFYTFASLDVGVVTSTTIVSMREFGFCFVVSEFLDGSTAEQVSKNMHTIEELQNNNINIDNVTSLAMLGSSLTSCYCTTNGASWVEKLNDLVDINIVSNGQSGGGIDSNMRVIAQNLNFQWDGGKAGDFKPKYIWWNNTANTTRYGVEGRNQLQNALEITKSVGATMILGAEEGSYYGRYNDAKQFDRLFRSFAEERGVLFSPLMLEQLHCYPTKVYAGFWRRGHGGFRVDASYFMHYDLLSRLPVENNIKLFKVRPQYKGGNPAITDLVYDDNFQRLRYFTAIAPGQFNERKTNEVDNLDSDANGNTDGMPTVGENLGKAKNTSEVGLFLQGKAVAFDKFALVEVICSKLQITTAKFSVISSVRPTKMYVAVTKNRVAVGGIMNTDIIRTTWVPVPFEYVNGEIRVAVNREDWDIQLYDKVRMLIETSGSFTLEKPIFSDFNGVKKEMPTLQNKWREHGAEQNGNTSFDNSLGDASSWLMNGNAIVAEFPNEIAQYTDYNTAKKHLELPDNDAYAEKTISVSSDCKKVAVRVVAQSFVPIQTTRFKGTATGNSKYISESVIYRNYDYPFSTLRVIIDDSYIIDKLVWNGWNELYFEMPVQYDAKNIKIRLQRNNFIDATLPNSDRVLMVHDVSVQKIG